MARMHPIAVTRRRAPVTSAKTLRTDRSWVTREYELLQVCPTSGARQERLRLRRHTPDTMLATRWAHLHSSRCGRERQQFAPSRIRSSGGATSFFLLFGLGRRSPPDQAGLHQSPNLAVSQRPPPQFPGDELHIRPTSLPDGPGVCRAISGRDEREDAGIPFGRQRAAMTC